MIRKFLAGLTGRNEKKAQRTKLIFETLPDVIYAIGDVHGCLSLLRKMEEAIIADAAEIDGEKYIVMLGDYIDRGPDSAGVIEHLLAPAPLGFTRICLAGNHEEIMLSYFDAPSPSNPWMKLGGVETLHSYGLTQAQLTRLPHRALLDSHIPDEHIDFLRNAPSLLAFPGICLVHAGLRAGVPLQKQRDEDLLWTRPDNSRDCIPRNFVLVHGHTSCQKVEITPWRINVDTGAFLHGVLSCLRYTKNKNIAVISVH